MFDCGLFFFFLYRIWHIHNLTLAAVVLLAHKNQNGRLQRMFEIGWSCSIMSLSYIMGQDIPLSICFFL